MAKELKDKNAKLAQRFNHIFHSCPGAWLSKLPLYTPTDIQLFGYIIIDPQKLIPAISYLRRRVILKATAIYQEQMAIPGVIIYVGQKEE